MADSGDSSPLSAAATDDTTTTPNGSDTSAAAAAPQPSLPPPPPPSRVRLMVSYGGRIQPRPHDNQLSYVNGETKILSLSLDRTAPALRFTDFAARLAALANRADLLCVKYQLPGEDLDALVSVTNDEDLEHLLVEYDRLHLFRAAAPSGSGGGSSRSGTTPRLRVFLFPLTPPPEPKQEQQQQRDWYLDLRSASPTPGQQQQQQPHPQVQSPPPLHAVPMAAVPQSMMVPKPLDFLFGLDCASFVPPPAVKVRDPAGEPPAAIRDNVPVEIPAKVNEDRVHNPNPAAMAVDNAMLAPAVSPTEFHRQIHDKLQLADNNATQQQQQPQAHAPAPVAAQQPQPQGPAPAVAQQQAPQAPAPVVAQQTPQAPAPVAAQQTPPSPALVAAQQSPPAAAPVVPAAQVLPRNGSDDSLTRAYPPAATTSPPEYYVPKFQEKPQAAAPFLPVPGRYASVAPGSGADHGPFFFIPAPPHGYYASTNPNGGTSYYAVPPHNGNGNGNGNGTAPAPSMSNTPAYPQVGYDSNGRAVYYTGLLPQYPSAVNGMSSAAAVLGSEPSVPVKPTVS